jgi:hypothetical protein
MASSGTGFQRGSRQSSTEHSSMVSPLISSMGSPGPTPTSMFGSSSQQQSELASNQVHELDSTSLTAPGPAELYVDDSFASTSTQWFNPAAIGPGHPAMPTIETCSSDRPRATLNSTQLERASKTYANSWSRYHDVQT